MWSGFLSSIPKGWALCDGTLGTPDLRDKFIRGAPNGIDPGDTGGISDHTHIMFPVNHLHTMLAGPGIDGTVSGRLSVLPLQIVNGITDSKDGRPPFFELAYIMDTGVI